MIIFNCNASILDQKINLKLLNYLESILSNMLLSATFPSSFCLEEKYKSMSELPKISFV